MSTPYFRFKQFSVWHDRCAMKVGTDGVLIGAWASALASEVDSLAESPVVPTAEGHILDIGTGSGLVALMLAAV